ncbi:uncharacterized protein B0I36DRAFT_318956 [Microdochium trichocladiopsis]|uniref:Uncharacterized protein n=1 Tax=Microdochium trichocladiopsis TaxID=1682393 RepID=A0A9P8YCG0_9PEZI|nr:uncharacterized protein B0I36DRAFT_318956 [Microdochium trichocladiopsis]KAH7035722.1 hypothetical protein B0I36DRAFT_318956 [Microdochium trichocladiopsis]
MGWFRTCRQAFVEGVEVLYGTNSFVIESRDLLDAILEPRTDGHVLAPYHLAKIRSLELRLDVLLCGKLIHAGRAGPERLPNFAGLASTFPDLRFLIISFLDTLYNDHQVRPTGRLGELRELLFDPLARAFAPLARQKKMPIIVELPENVFLDFLHNSDFVQESLGNQGSNGWGTWLRYPIVTETGGSMSTNGDNLYYYLKQGSYSSAGIFIHKVIGFGKESAEYPEGRVC